ncbi:hypothetical protein [Sphingobium yanoikuyae]|uniref:hypothetical protein n=1 Tax=Sphingobium yanoikuyae TaxID=13690 RepID=UPI0022DE4649|nr:hypothetical protein [Sphingobium yanoikuyae]WBQ15018.1 hypothetical protein PAE53_13890 [Sphingobium yanoikuyae]
MNDLLRDVEAYLARTGMAPTAFGVGALRDRHFVRQLRNGRRTFRETEDKVRIFMATHVVGDNGRKAATSPDSETNIIGEAA